MQDFMEWVEDHAVVVLGGVLLVLLFLGILLLRGCSSSREKPVELPKKALFEKLEKEEDQGVEVLPTPLTSWETLPRASVDSRERIWPKNPYEARQDLENAFEDAKALGNQE